MRLKTTTAGFGAPTEFGAHVFHVVIPAAKAESVSVVEDYGLIGGEIVRVVLPRFAWSGIAEAARKDFNQRLKAQKVLTGSWKTGDVVIDRILGKELCVLAWAAEKAQSTELPVICKKWTALRPEERWWLYSMTASEAGCADDVGRGWRRALHAALSDPGSIEIEQVHRKFKRQSVAFETPSLF
jgi:Protein of unknown function (DUF3780)